MTLFSYSMGFVRKKNFREPELLNELLKRLDPKSTLITLPFAGWFIHYLVGLLFIFLYQLFWHFSGSQPTLTNGILLGALNGIVGILGWQFTFYVHPNPPQIDFKEYYIQLFFAHIIFGASASIAFSSLTNLSS